MNADFAHSNKYAALDAFIPSAMKRLNLPGAALAVVESGRLAHFRGFGRTGLGDGAPTAQTPFFIGSLTKSFTALAVMQLVECGALDLDAPVQRYLPWFNTADASASAHVLVRYLLHHTSGIGVGPGWERLADFGVRSGADARLARQLAALKLKRAPGATHEYSNTNYDLLGWIIEAVSGETWAEYIRRHIFEPLGMAHSYTDKADARKNGLAVGHQSWFGFPFPAPNLPVPHGSLASGQLISCAEDMARYLNAHLNGGAGVLSAAGMAELHRPAVSAALFGDEPGWYGMGWYIEEQGGQKVLFHSGLVPDYYAFMALLPEQDKGALLLVNMDHFTMQLSMADVTAGLIRLLAGQAPPRRAFAAVPWVQRGLLLLPLLQIIEMLATLLSLYQKKQGRRRLILPLIPHVLAGLTVIPMLGKIRGFIKLFAPDFAFTARVFGGLALLWIPLRALLFRQAWLSPRSGKPT